MTERYHHHLFRQISMDQAHPGLHRGQETTLVWNNWFKTPLDDSNTAFLLRLHSNGSDADLRFYFRQAPEDPSPSNPEGEAGNGDGGDVLPPWWNLCVDLRSCSRAMIQFDLKIDWVDRERNVVDEGASIRKVLTFPEGVGLPSPTLVVKDKFVRREREDPTAVGGRGANQNREGGNSLKISVTPLLLELPGEVEAAPVEVSLPQSLRDLFFLGEQENFADLKLETKDNRVIHCHRLILGARSSVFRDMIKEKEQESGFTGMTTLKVEVNVKPMKVLLHWIYNMNTVKVQQDSEDCLKEVLEAAIKFGLIGIVRILSHKLITICNRENMVDLFRIAQRNKLEIARADIAKFIKEELRNPSVD